jgi:small subunit ribosomal protein S3
MVGWKSRWYASKQEFSTLLLEDLKLRSFIKGKYKFAGIPKIEIERTRDEVKVILHTARPGIIIGRKGQEVERLQEELQALVGRRINIKIEEIARPEIEAQLVAEDIAEQLAKRASFRRCMKRAMETTMEAGAKGIKIQLAGRLGGSEMARREKAIAGSIPLSTLRAKIDYGFTEAMTPQGHIGVQVWVNQGMYQEDETDGADAQEGQAPKKPKRTYKR